MNSPSPAQEKTTESPDVYEDLARSLSAAYMAQILGVGVGYAYKKYASKKPGSYWVNLARTVIADMTRAHGTMIEEAVANPAQARIQ